MVLDITQIIEQEMARYRSKAAYLNNFYLKLPDDHFKHGSYYRDLLVEIGRMEQNEIEHGADPEEEKRHGCSDLYLNQKGREFLETIEKALVDEGIPIEKVKQLQRQRAKDFNKIKELNELVFPAYIRLRRIGYSWFDLCG